MDYYYDKSNKQWCDMDLVFGSTRLKDTEPNMIEELRHARTNHKFMILSNKHGEVYPGIKCDYIYRDASCLKLLTYCTNSQTNKRECWTYCAYAGKGVSGRSRFPLDRIINKKDILKYFIPDYSYTIEYVEDVSYLGHNVDEAYKMAYRERLFNELDDNAKLYYQIEGKYNFS